METRANYVLIGTFTLAMIASMFGFVYWFQKVNGARDRVPYNVVFSGPVSGLRNGSAVNFNGIRVGEVAQVMVNPKDPRQVVARITVDRGTPIRTDTVIGLEFAGLTGVASVALTGGTATAPPVGSDTDTADVPTLAADPAASQDITGAARAVLAEVNRLLIQNEGTIHDTLTNLNTFTEALARNSQRIDNIMAGVENLTSKGDLQETLKTFRGLAENLDKRVNEISVGLTRFSQSGLRDVQAMVNDGRRAIADIDRAVRNLDRNPQRLLFGGGQAIPEYNGERR